VEPRWVFLENVPGLAGHGLGHVLGSLAGLGFNADWGCLSAGGVGAPHQRRRLFILAWRVSDAERNAVRDQPERGKGAARKAHPGDAQPGDLGQAVADSDPGGRQPVRVQDQPGQQCKRRDQPDGCDLPFWPPGPSSGDAWRDLPAHSQPAVCGMVTRLPNGLDRLRCLGNAVVPLQAAVAFRTLATRAGLSLW